jgi:diacylglycerol kinase
MKKFYNSFLHAARGARAAFSEQLNLKIQLVVAMIATGLGFYFEICFAEWSILLLTIGLVLGLEMVNTALENMVDLVTRERNPLAGKIKDIGAGAVLVASILALIVGWLIFSPYFLAQWQ